MEREMSEEQKFGCSSVEKAIQRQIAYRNKVPCSSNEETGPVNRSPSFCNWTDTSGSISNASLHGILELYQHPTSPKAQAPVERLSSSPMLQNWIENSPTKNGVTSEPSSPMARSLISASRDWIGPSIPSEAGSGLKRKAPSHDIQFIPRGNPSPSPSSSQMTKKPVHDLFCNICEVSCSSALTLRQHLIGRPHKAKLEFMKLKRNTISGDRKGKPRCNTCQIWCSDWNAMQMHLKGQKHKAKLQEFEVCKKNGGEKIDKKPIRCELCLVNCMNEDLFKMHLKGRQHAAREELKRRGML
ncbi:hypothetical protein BUALT_Bualt02G0154600 [Buddleja alternifolia]|uniref:C2H2-type domain-containing protein n=1 Tax=Buddleja alternifolia TaxID=168488 RepID=A0AAV6Y1R1_9LAMI|nr:hypothetical protein BUALT_Bualt02G0154600 [Buddleja alternifolia]